MTLDSDEIVRATDLTVWLADVGTTVPTSPTATPTGFANAGYTGEEGSNFATAPEFRDIFAHQAATAVKTFKSRDAANLQVALLQWNTATWEAAFGGGAVTITGGTSKFTPPDATASTPKAVIVDTYDDLGNIRLIIPKCRVRSGVTLNLSRVDASPLPVTFAVEATVIGAASWYVLFDNVTSFPAG